MQSETTVQLGNTTAVRTVLDDGTQLFRLDPTDTERMDIMLFDNVGRTRVVKAYKTTMLILVPVGELGALTFDRHPVAEARDEHGRVVFMQRPHMSREEVFDMVKKGVEDMGSTVKVASMDDLRRRVVRP